MLPDDITAQLQPLRDKLSHVEGETRIIKHDFKNFQQSMYARELRLDKFEEQTRTQFEDMRKETAASFEKVNNTLTTKLDALSLQFSALNVKQEKGTSFYAGMAAVGTTLIAVVMGLAKVLFGGHG